MDKKTNQPTKQTNQKQKHKKRMSWIRKPTNQPNKRTTTKKKKNLKKNVMDDK